MTNKVLVTGGDGFIGSHVVESFVREGFDVQALAMYNAFGSAGWLDSLTPEIRSAVDVKWGDIRDPQLVLDLVKDRDLVAHLAALIGIPFSYVAPNTYIETNVHGTLNLLEAIRRTSDCKLISTSTSEVYGTPTSIPITESHPLNAQSPYAASKIAADQLCTAYAASFSLNVFILRPFNTFGPRQSLRAIIPSVLTQLLSGYKTLDVGNLETARDFTYVTDTADAFVAAARAHTVPGEVIQLGTGVSYTMSEVVEVCQEVTGVQIPYRVVSERIRPTASEVQVLLSDPSLAADRLNWIPSVSFEDGIRMTVEWWAKRLRDGDYSKFHL